MLTLNNAQGMITLTQHTDDMKVLKEYGSYAQIKEGKDLTANELALINSWRQREFHSQPIVLSPDDENWGKKFFLVKDHQDITAFGRLHETELEFRTIVYPILGIATIVATEKGKGYGSRLLKSMHAFIEADGRTAIGFCDPRLDTFYSKCGFDIITGTDRFLYMDSNGQLHKTDKPGDVLCLEGKDKVITDIMNNPYDDIYLFRPFW